MKLMGNYMDKLVDIIKKQAAAFLIEANEFYPFATYVNNNGQIIPVGAFFESDRTPSVEIIGLLEKGINQRIVNGECKLGAIVIDIAIQ